MGQLPGPRVNISRPFSHTGVDFAGPLSIKLSAGRRVKTTKAYIAIFVCLATKAIHLEAVSNLTSTAFIAAYRRFAGRRGAAEQMYSDCGTNFVGAAKRLKKLSEEWCQYSATEVMEMLSTVGTQWHFIPPGSPHFGGLWEAGVKAMKHHFKRMAGYNLTLEELTTILCQIEACLNSRPLCPISTDPESLEILTPGHFLTGGPLLLVPECDLGRQHINRLTRWQLVQRIQQEFWTKWSSEYLARLQQRPKWKKQVDNVKIGDLVLIKDEQLPPGKWLLGRIVETQSGKDGLTRVVTIKNRKTTIKRPITKICLLPIEDNDSENLQNTHKKIIETSVVPEKLSKKPVKKNLRTQYKSLLNILVYCFMILNLVIGIRATKYVNENIKITPLKAITGIYFEDIGRVNLVSNTWQLIVYYDLENYWDEQKMYDKCLQLLKTNCNREKNSHTYGDPQIGVLSDQDKMACITIHEKLKLMVDEIHQKNQILYHGNQEQQKNFLTREKRSAPLNIIGNIQHALFGVLDEDFAKKYEENIHTIKKNERHLQKLLLNQTSIAEMTKNIVKKNSEDINKIAGEFSKQLEAMSESEQAHTSFMTAAFNLILHIITYQQTQDALIGLVLDTQHGKINPLLLSPKQFVKQITEIQSHIPADVQIPGYKPGDNLSTVYGLISTKTRVLKEKIIIEITIPLSNREQFQLFKLIPLPTTQNDQTNIRLSSYNIRS